MYEPALTDPTRWGLPLSAVEHLGQDLVQFWEHYRPLFQTRTRDPSPCALTFWRGQLTMEDQRTFANIDRRVNGQDGQTLQHFMSESPWEAHAVFRQIQADMRATPTLAHGGVVILDESADVKAGAASAGAGRQHNGRLGKLALSQVATTLVYFHPETRTWALVDGELFLPQAWFSPAWAEQRARVGVPADRPFATKQELGLRMIRRAQAQGLPFEQVVCDEFYGRDRGFRAELDRLGLHYAAEVRPQTQVYLQTPTVGLRPARPRGRKPTRPRVLSPYRPVTAESLAEQPGTVWQPALRRSSERGPLRAQVAVFRVWTVTPEGQVRAEWLVLQRHPDHRVKYTLLNGPEDLPVAELVDRSAWRYFTERTYQDAKSELGWDDFQALKYRAWEHEMALTAAATWFLAGVKLNWQATYGRDPALAQQFQLEVLPALSTANVRDLLMASLPLTQLSPEQAQALVVHHLIHRARSTHSRRNASSQPNDSS